MEPSLNELSPERSGQARFTRHPFVLFCVSTRKIIGLGEAHYGINRCSRAF